LQNSSMLPSWTGSNARDIDLFLHVTNEVMRLQFIGAACLNTVQTFPLPRLKESP